MFPQRTQRVHTPVQAMLTLLMAFGGPLTSFAFNCPTSPLITPRHGTIIASEGSQGWTTRPQVPELQTERTTTAKENRVPWEWQRFIKQSSKFIELPSLSSTSGARALSAGESFGDLKLFPLDDVVMGGASASSFDNDSRRWKGEVTSVNSGGFVGIRCKTLSPLDLSATQGVELKLKPDGKERRYKCVLRDSNDFNGICWTASFTVGSLQGKLASLFTNGVETVRIPHESLVPTIFAKTVPDVRIDLTNIVGLQLALSKFEYDGGLNPLFTDGSFELDVVDVATF